jgi:hypothetical protein
MFRTVAFVGVSVLADGCAGPRHFCSCCRRDALVSRFAPAIATETSLASAVHAQAT